ncbi:NADPH oxidase 4-like [Toxorhynchites rutilus septentrionalis]|uniref:NADPH oxidase 4-like n=1 Tax=Toxorhynchites rutilus septentrionalis TaxID=329112 RepID=UPI00247AE199|nr:NADPH oxidase 4-like [Toxorhynchites rutilus septentrionalis]
MEGCGGTCFVMKKAMFKYFLALILIGLGLGTFCRAYSHYHHEPQYFYLTKILGNGFCISRGTAPVLNVTMVLITLPMCRSLNNLFNALFGKSSIQILVFYLEKIKVLHIYFGVGLISVGLIHTLAHVVNIHNFIENYDERFATINWAVDENDSMLRLLFLTPTGFSGCAMMATLFVILHFSRHQMRDSFYNIFFRIHHLFLLFYCMMLYHPLSNIIKFQTNLQAYPIECESLDKQVLRNDTHLQVTACSGVPEFDAGQKRGWIWPMAGLSVYIFDAVYRYVTIHSDHRAVTTLQSSLLPGKGVYLKLGLPRKNHMKIRNGQYILLQCSVISSIEWHPFTIIDFSTDSSNSMSLAVSVRGDWTKKLYHIVAENERIQHGFSEIECSKIIEFLVDGPYPSVMGSMVQYKRIVYVGAGIGITPFVGFARYLLNSRFSRPLRIHLIWIVRSVEILTWFADVINALQDKLWRQNQPDRLSLKLYWTHNFDECLLVDHFCNYPALNARISPGRPDWDKTFQELTMLYPKKTVTVFSCGPKALTEDVRNMCAKYGKDACNFRHFHDGFG